MSALIGALRVSLSAETGQFEAGMKRAQRTANQTRSTFQKAFGGLGGIVKGGLAGLVSGLSVGLLVQGTKAALDYAGSLGEVAQQLGVTTRELQTFRYTVQQNGGTLEQADQALGKFSLSISKALSGSKQAASAFQSVGVSLEDLRNESRGDVLGKIADGMKRTGGASANAAAGVAIFGKGFQKIVPTLDLGSAGMTEAAQAAEQLGIVLSDEQIQNADRTADKIDQLQTVLKVQIAGAVANNASAIDDLANSLSQLVGHIQSALRWWTNFSNAIDVQTFSLQAQNPFFSKEGRDAAALRASIARGKLTNNGAGTGFGGSSVTVTLPAARKKAPRSGGGAPTNFLGGGGGGSGKKGRASADTSLRDAFQFDQDLLRAQADVLRAQQQLATNYSERAAISIQMLNLDQQGFDREMEYAVASGELSKAQAGQLKAEYAKKDALERQAVLAEEEKQRLEDYNALDILDLELQRDILQSQEQLADTSKEQRDIRLRLLDLDYRIERARLEQVLADEKASYAAKEEARRRLSNLSRTQGNDTKGVLRDTAGPFERAQLQFGDLSEEMEQLKVNGIMGAADALTALTDGFGSFKDAAISAIKQVIAEFIRLQTIKFLMNVAGSAFGAPGAGAAGGGYVGIGGFMGGAGGTGLPGFATGGGFNVMGRGGIDRNVLALNGLPIARVSHGERVSISNDNARGGNPVNMTLNFTGPVSRETMMQAGSKVRAAIASANRKGA